MQKLLRTILLATLALVATAPTLQAQEVLPEPAITPIEATPQATTEALLCDDPQFERGQPHKVVDSVGWVFGIPKKIILWDRRAVNHRVTPETEQHLAAYLDANGLGSTKVRINQYDPRGEWRRLRANKEVGAGWRYTFGTVNLVFYTIAPGRLFGSDRYNPYTDSVYIYSDIPCIAQEQAAYAKMVHARENPGTYYAVTSLPVVQLWPEKQSKNDVLDYTLSSGTPEMHEEATRVLYAEFGAEVGGQASLFLGSNLPLTLAGAGIGHIAARTEPLIASGSASETAAEVDADLAPPVSVAEMPTDKVIR